MRLSIRLFAALRERAGAEAIDLDGLEDGLDVAGLRAVLAREHPELGSLQGVRVAVGTKYVREDHVLADGDQLSLIPPVSGGAPDADGALERGVFELSAEPLDPLACQRRVAHDTCGALVVFTGVTRDTNRGRPVTHLDYEAFEDMTGPEMARIFERCRLAFGDVDGERPERRLRMLCQHRVGRVAVGEPSVVIAVASPHRDRAYLASRFLIDELKGSMPIWKKESYPDGEHWVGERS